MSMNAVDPPIIPAIKAITFYLPDRDLPCRVALDVVSVL